MSYGGAKAAVNNFTQWLSVHLAPTGCRVNAIAPGFFLTAQNYKLLMGDNDTPTARCQQILVRLPHPPLQPLLPVLRHLLSAHLPISAVCAAASDPPPAGRCCRSARLLMRYSSSFVSMGPFMGHPPFFLSHTIRP